MLSRSGRWKMMGGQSLSFSRCGAVLVFVVFSLYVCKHAYTDLSLTTIIRIQGLLNRTLSNIHVNIESSWMCHLSLCQG